ncbi:MAG: pyridoxal 5'-phosphate synthase glutaminase subunit PdxT [Anaerostipes sp.]|nr:pyridoxal 5'-phosphate synthase glutaminase subunit PdxT [Anaerostipes sp.]
MKIGILALQGAFEEHGRMLDQLGVEHFEIRKKDDLKQEFHGIILPGGESTVMGKLLLELDLFEDIQTKINNGLPVLGTCAGLILLAKQVKEGNPHLATMDINVQRNAYGRQLGSFNTQGMFDHLGTVPMTFIRAPYIESVSGSTKVLATVDEHIVAARQENQCVVAFHPELTQDTRVHEYFLRMV